VRFPGSGSTSASTHHGTFEAVSADVYYPTFRTSLANGLRVVASPTPGLGVVAVNLWYDVGSRHEQPERQGFAHLFEHLMFQGSRHVESGEHFTLLQGHGASLNATTSFDRTNYFESGPTPILDLALWLEADRMGYLGDALTEENLANQVDVVAQERGQRYDNVPYGTVFERILPLVFDADHPYGHLPIGNMQQLKEATLDEVTAFHSAYYKPGNAVLTIVGDVSEDDAFAKAEEYFGHIPSGDTPLRRLPARLPALEAVARIDIEEDVPSPAVWFAARLPADEPYSRELAAVELASSIIGEGETSHLHRRLVRQDQTAVSAGMGVNTLIAGNSLGVASVRAVPDQDLDSVVATVAEVLDRFAATGPVGDELAMARAHAERDWLDEMATASGRADTVSGYTLLHDDPDLVNQRLDLLRSITPREVQEAAAVWLLPALNAQARVLPDRTQAQS
jgi:zinc protease